MRYLCTNCSYIYDEALGDTLEWISAWTRLEDLWDNFVCPSCYESLDFFQEIRDEVNYIEDGEKTTFIEDLHTIVYDIKWDELFVQIGKNESHPMTEEHFIASVSLYDEVWEIIEEQFLSADFEGEITFSLDYIDDFEIRIRCNQHGVWGYKVISNI